MKAIGKNKGGIDNGSSAPVTAQGRSAQYLGVLLNLLQKLLPEYGVSAASNLVCFLLPKQTVEPAMSKRINEAKVIQNAGAVLVVKSELLKFPTSRLTNANKAISMANAMRVMPAARKEARDARSVINI